MRCLPNNRKAGFMNTHSLVVVGVSYQVQLICCVFFAHLVILYPRRSEGGGFGWSDSVAACPSVVRVCACVCSN